MHDSMEPARTFSTAKIPAIECVSYVTGALLTKVGSMGQQAPGASHQNAKVPTGRLYPEQRLLFTGTEVGRFRDHADGLVPFESMNLPPPAGQLRLLQPNKS